MLLEFDADGRLFWTSSASPPIQPLTVHRSVIAQRVLGLPAQ